MIVQEKAQVKAFRERLEGFLKKDLKTVNVTELKSDLIALLEEVMASHVQLELQNELLEESKQQIDLERRKYHDLYEFAPVAYITINHKNKIVELNQAAVELIGLGKDLLLNKPIMSVLHESSVVDFLGLKESACKQLKLKSGAIKFVRQQQVIHTQAQIAVYNDVGDKDKLYRLTITDISHQVEQRKALKDSEVKYRRFVEHSIDGFLLTNTNGIITEWYNALEKPVFSKDQILGTAVWDYCFELLLPEEQTNERYLHVKSSYEKFYKTGQASFLNKKIDRELSSGQIIQQTSFAVPSGAKFQLATVLRDITEQRKTEQKNAWLATIIENTKDICVIKDLNLRVLGTNPAFAEATGKKESELIGKTDSEIFNVSEDEEPIRTYMNDERLAQNLEEGEFIDREEPVRYPDGEIRYVRTRKFPIFEQDRIIATANISTDITEQKKIRNELVENEKKYRSFFENMLVGFVLNEIVLDSKGIPVDFRLLDVNPAFELLTKLKREKIVGKKIRELAPNLAPLWMEAFGNVIKTGRSTRFRKFAEPLGRYVDAMAYVLSQTRFAIIFHDVTEEMLAHQELQKTSQQLEIIFENAPVVMLLIDKERRVQKINSQGMGMVGKDIKDILGKYGGDVLDCIHANDDPNGCGFSIACTDCKVRRLVENTFKTGKGFYKQELKFTIERNAEAEQIILLVSTAYLQDAKEPMVLLSVDDVTQEKRIEEALLENEERFRILSELAMEGILIHQNGMVIEANKAFSRLTGFAFSEIFGENIIKKFFPPKYHSVLATNLKQKTRESLELEILTQNGGTIAVEATTYGFSFRGEKAQVTAIRDIRDQKLMQQRIAKAIINTEERDKNYFARELHDGIGPLLSTSKIYIKAASISENLDRRKTALTKLEETVNEAIQSIRDISNRLSPHILENFGLITAIEAFCSKLKDLHPIKFVSTYNINRRFKKDIELSLYRVVVELINNGLKYSGADTIAINTNISDKQIVLKYNDNGIGFDVEKAIQGHNGMGLFNIQSRIESLNGYIEIKSGPNSGVSVFIEIPITS